MRQRSLFEDGSLLETIGTSAFRYTRGLRLITLPANLKEIGERAFFKSGLEEVIFEDDSHLEAIGDDVSAGPFRSTFLNYAAN
mmetsp:Transcript_38498/g.75201  ORF Transcript_38498/g.75201 Transcript_38498/m.75201 type:complete len:83 (-) Transcript_38498:774-1022(-)